MNTQIYLPAEFHFRLWQDGSWLGKIECAYKSEVFKKLIEAGYNWECPWHTHRGRPISLNWLQRPDDFKALL